MAPPSLVGPAAQGDEPGADIADRETIVLAKVGDRLVVRHQAAFQPHRFHVAPGLPLKAAARLNPVEVAEVVGLQQNRRVIARPAGRLRRNPPKPQAAKIKRIHKNIDHSNRILFTDAVFQPLRGKVLWPRASPSMKRFIKSLAPNVEGILSNLSISHSLGHEQT